MCPVRHGLLTSQSQVSFIIQIDLRQALSLPTTLIMEAYVNYVTTELQ